MHLLVRASWILAFVSASITIYWRFGSFLEGMYSDIREGMQTVAVAPKLRGK